MMKPHKDPSDIIADDPDAALKNAQELVRRVLKVPKGLIDKHAAAKPQGDHPPAPKPRKKT